MVPAPHDSYRCRRAAISATLARADDEYALLPDALKWRHVRYEPNGIPPIDFTWEREWRLNTDQLAVDPQHCTLIVPDKASERELIDRHEAEEYVESELRAQEEPHGYYPGSDMMPFPWRVYRLGD